MYDTRVYKERRKARFESDPEYRLLEQQRHRERYQRRKAEKLAAENANVEPSQLPPQQQPPPQPELLLDIKPKILIPHTSTSRHIPTTPLHPHQTIIDIVDHHDHVVELEEEEEEVPETEQDEEDLEELEAKSESFTQTMCRSQITTTTTDDMQTVSIKLPQNMAVLVVPVNLTSITDDDAMQLQQIGKRVAIVRGSMTNVAEFQVLPAMTFDAHSKVAMETDIRQIVINEGDEVNGPTIQITPQVIETEQEIIDEMVAVIPINETELEPETVPPPPPVAIDPTPTPRPKSKLYSYIEAIRCGRCLSGFDDLTSLSQHQRSEHKMMVIRVGEGVSGTTDTPRDRSLFDTAQLLSMEDKIAARLEKCSEVKMQVQKRQGTATKRKYTTGSSGRGRGGGISSRGGRGGVSGVSMGSKTGRAGLIEVVKREEKGSNLMTCLICSLNFVGPQAYNAHLQQAHHQVVNERSVYQADYVEEQEEVNDEEVEEEEVVIVQHQQQRLKPRNAKYSIVSTQYKQDQPPTEHIITDTAGNEIVVHADTPEQLQELLASLESGHLQMVNGGGGGGVTQQGVQAVTSSGGGGSVYVIEEGVVEERVTERIRGRIGGGGGGGK